MGNSLDVKDIELQARGRWPSIFEALGIEVITDKKHHPCVLCGGTDRWRYTNLNGDGMYLCNQCGAGTGFSLVRKVFGLTFPETLEKVNNVLGGCSKMETEKKIDIAKVKEMLNKIWKESVPLTGSDPVSLYLHSRKLTLTPENIRYCPELYETDTKKHYPAMVAMVMNSKGIPVALHRTYLSRDVIGKADIESPKKLTPGTEPLSGCAIRLFPAKGDTLAVAEGIETSIACMQIFDIPTWACVSNTILEGFIVPEGIRKIIICSDNDANMVGQLSAYKLANRLYKADFLVDVRVPEVANSDWADTIL